MPLVLLDRVRETTAVTGTNDAVLLGAVTGFQAFSVIGNGNTCYYTIADQAGGSWEVGIGTYTTTGPTLQRTTVLSSSNSGSKVSFGIGTKDVFVTYPSSRAVYVDGTSIVPGTSATLPTTSGGTGLSSYTAGDLPYYATGTALSKLGIGTNGQVLTSSGTAPQWTNASSIVGGAAGSNTQIQFNNSGALGASASLTWNGTTLSTTGFTASSDSSFTSTGALLISKGTAGQQPGSPVTGMLRYNTTSNQFEGYSGSSPAWNPVGGASISNDTSTSSNLYPTFVNATSGTATTVYTSNAKLLYKPSTGELQASELLASNGVVLNNQTMNTSYTMPAGYSGMSTGPFTVAGGVTFTIPSGSRHVVL